MGPLTRRAVAALIAAALVVPAACGATASAPPSVVPSPPPTPAPTPIPADDVAEAFIALLGAPDTSASGEISGTLSAPGGSGAVRGEVVFDGRDHRVSLTVARGEAESVRERVELGEDAWARSTPGPWLAVERLPAEDTLAASLAAIPSVEAVGTETRDGRTLHRLRPSEPAALPPAALGLSDPAQAEAAVSVEFLAESDGTPAVILVDATWTERFDGADVAVELAFEIELLTWDAVVSIRAPDDVWAVHESPEIGYSMAHPADWTVESTDGTDAFRLDGIEYIHVAPQELTAPATTDQFVEAILRSYEDDLDTRPDSNEPVTLGGQPARRLVLHLENAEGAPVVLFDYVTVRAGTGWEVYLATLAGTTEDRDLAFFETFIATFRFAG